MNFGRKLLLLVLLAPLLNLCYFLPQWAPLFAGHLIPMTAIDRAVPFEPDWVLPYLSMYIFLLLPPLLAYTTDQLRRYAIGMAIMFVTAALCFFLYPITYPRPALPASANVIYRLIVHVDQPINSLPSLHAGMTIYAILFAARIFAADPPRRRRFLLAISCLWAAIIFYGTLATKQHYFVDLPAGGLLAWVSHWAVWRGSNRRSSVQ
jgi:hypothetical protein